MIKKILFTLLLCTATHHECFAMESASESEKSHSEPITSLTSCLEKFIAYTTTAHKCCDRYTLKSKRGEPLVKFTYAYFGTIPVLGGTNNDHAPRLSRLLNPGTRPVAFEPTDNDIKKNKFCPRLATLEEIVLMIEAVEKGDARFECTNKDVMLALLKKALLELSHKTT